MRGLGHKVGVLLLGHRDIHSPQFLIGPKQTQIKPKKIPMTAFSALLATCGSERPENLEPAGESAGPLKLCLGSGNWPLGGLFLSPSCVYMASGNSK